MTRITPKHIHALKRTLNVNTAILTKDPDSDCAKCIRGDSLLIKQVIKAVQELVIQQQLPLSGRIAKEVLAT